MKELSFTVTPAGHMPGNEHRQFDDCIRSMAGKRVVVRISQYQKKRSNNQNAYLWGVVYPPIVQAFRDAGNDTDDEDIHNYLKEHVGKLKRVIVTPDGEVLHVAGSTKRLTTSEMEVYLEKVRAWAAETLGVAISLPNEPPIDAYTE